MSDNAFFTSCSCNSVSCPEMARFLMSDPTMADRLIDFAGKLGVTACKIAEIKNTKFTLLDQIIAIIHTWVSRMGLEASTEVLSNLLAELEFRYLQEHLMEQYGSKRIVFNLTCSRCKERSVGNLIIQRTQSDINSNQVEENMEDDVCSMMENASVDNNIQFFIHEIPEGGDVDDGKVAHEVVNAAVPEINYKIKEATRVAANVNKGWNIWHFVRTIRPLKVKLKVKDRKKCRSKEIIDKIKNITLLKLAGYTITEAPNLLNPSPLPATPDNNLRDSAFNFCPL